MATLVIILVASVSTYTLSRSSVLPNPPPQRSCAALKATGGASAEATAATLVGEANAKLFDAATLKVLDSLASLGQGHLFEGWPDAGQDEILFIVDIDRKRTEHKKRFSEWVTADLQNRQYVTLPQYAFWKLRELAPDAFAEAAEF